MENWRKSTRSSAQGGQCVEVADDSSGVMVRDTTNRNGGTLNFTTSAWARFIKTL